MSKKSTKAKAAASTETSSEETKDVAQLTEDRANIISAARRKRQSDIDASLQAAEDDEMINAMMVEAAGESVETGPETGDQESVAAAREIEREQAAKGDGKDEVETDDENQLDNEMVDVKIYGKQYRVPKRDIDRAGGVDAYQKDRAASIRLTQASTAEAKLRQRQAEIERREKELKEREERLKKQSSQSGVQKAELPEGAQHNTDRTERIRHIVGGLYSGNEEQAEQAISQLMDDKPHLSVDEIANRVVAMLKDSEPEPERPQPSSQDRNAIPPDIASDINSAMARHHSDLMADPDQRALAQAKFREWRDLPENEGRSLVDIALDAGDYAKRKLGLGAQIEQRNSDKRGLPARSSASAARSPEPEERVPSRSEHVKRLRQRAGLEVS